MTVTSSNGADRQPCAPIERRGEKVTEAPPPAQGFFRGGAMGSARGEKPAESRKGGPRMG